jgi:hypothetical protein
VHQRLLVITGIPGAGKSNLIRALDARAWKTLLGDRAALWAEQDHVAWDDFIAGDKRSLLHIASDQPVGLAVEWGFPGPLIGVVEQWLSEGLDIWFLDGDHDAAFASWRVRNPDQPESEFWDQLRGLVLVDARISEAFGSRRVTAVMSGPQHVPVEHLLRLMGVS